MGALAILTREHFKIPVTPFINREIGTVDTTAVRLLRGDPDRLGFFVVNLSANNLFIGPFPNVSSARGILVSPNGGVVGFLWDEDFTLVGMEWSAVGSAAGTTLLTVEYTS